jgi:hypothetical protein
VRFKKQKQKEHMQKGQQPNKTTSRDEMQIEKSVQVV